MKKYPQVRLKKSRKREREKERERNKEGKKERKKGMKKERKGKTKSKTSLIKKHTQCILNKKGKVLTYLALF